MFSFANHRIASDSKKPNMLMFSGYDANISTKHKAHLRLMEGIFFMNIIKHVLICFYSCFILFLFTILIYDFYSVFKVKHSDLKTQKCIFSRVID